MEKEPKDQADWSAAAQARTPRQSALPTHAASYHDKARRAETTTDRGKAPGTDMGAPLCYKMPYIPLAAPGALTLIPHPPCRESHNRTISAPWT